VRPPAKLADWLTLLGLFAIALLINAIMAVLGLFILELLGLWPINEDVGSRATRVIPSPYAAARWVG
jgi:hypothetical protein